TRSTPSDNVDSALTADPAVLVPQEIVDREVTPSPAIAFILRSALHACVGSYSMTIRTHEIAFRDFREDRFLAIVTDAANLCAFCSRLPMIKIHTLRREGLLTVHTRRG